MSANIYKIGLGLLSVLLGVFYTYNSGFDAGVNSCKIEAQRLEIERQKQVDIYEGKLKNAMAENSANRERVTNYQLDNARLVARLRVLETERRKSRAGAVEDGQLARCERHLVDGAGVVERCSGLLSRFATDRKTLESLD